MDLSQDSTPSEGTGNDTSNTSNIDLLSYKKREENLYLGFKFFSFAVAILMGSYFLCVGLNVAKNSTLHIQSMQTSFIKFKSEQLRVLSLQKDQEKLSDLKDSKDEKTKLLAKEEVRNKNNFEDSSDGFVFSTGSMVTLVAFIFGVGLTLLLSVLKFVFIRNEEKKQLNTIDIATPLSELVKGLADWLKKKAS